MHKANWFILSLYYVGKNKRLQGLAAAILKLWQKSPIAKIAIKYGVPNTDNEAIANELKASSYKIYCSMYVRVRCKTSETICVDLAHAIMYTRLDLHDALSSIINDCPD